MKKLPESIEHDLYLRRVALGEIEGERTGYPSVDKPWLKYYSEEAIQAELPECSLYEYLWQNNREHPKDNGMTEVAATAVVENRNVCKNGSIGVPFPANNVMIYDNENGKEHKYGEIRELCQRELPEYSCPSCYEFIDNLPLTAVGKVDYKALEG